MAVEDQNSNASPRRQIPQWARVFLTCDILLRLIGVGTLYYWYFRTPSRNWGIWWDNYLHETGGAARGHLSLLLCGLLLWFVATCLMLIADIQLLRSKREGAVQGGMGVLLVIALVVWQMTDVTEYRGVSLVHLWQVSQAGFLGYYTAYVLVLCKCGQELGKNNAGTVTSEEGRPSVGSTA